jgi:pyrroloquinoline quinone biosynthesis protein D
VSAVALKRPRLAPGARLGYDRVREKPILLYPEGAAVLNETAVSVLELCDGVRTLDDIAATLGEAYAADVRADVERLLGSLADRGLVVDAAA